ncbi:MAG TPA: hypothetical protein VK386_02365, partial [Acidimicrobiales bacterium]|nr:hypothetical protein [Acidimicrobiales bacterium]
LFVAGIGIMAWLWRRRPLLDHKPVFDAACDPLAATADAVEDASPRTHDARHESLGSGSALSGPAPV